MNTHKILVYRFSGDIPKDTIRRLQAETDIDIVDQSIPTMVVVSGPLAAITKFAGNHDLQVSDVIECEVAESIPSSKYR